MSEQDSEIQSAQEKFQDLLSTIENELGTEIQVTAPEESETAEESQEAAEEDVNQDQPKQEESAQTDFFA